MSDHIGKLDTLLAPDADWQGLRHRLVDAQVETLRMYLEKQPPDRFVGALERLIECTRASFSQEEELILRMAAMPDSKHRARHETVMLQLESLRQGVLDLELDRGRILACLIIVDRELTSHISDVVVPPARGHKRQGPSLASETAEALTHH